MSKAKVSKGVIYSILAANAVSIVLFFIRAGVTQNNRYWFLFWNLFLAWVPFIVVLVLLDKLKTRRLASPLPLSLTIVFVLFLPNSFYIISDLIHLQNTGEIGVLFDSVLFMSIIINGMIAGMSSVYLFHQEMLKRFKKDIAHTFVAALFILVGFAIYLGRSLRWNSWDVIARPFGLIFDVSERLINPLAYPQFFVTTITFALLLGSTYAVIWNFANNIRNSKK